MLTGLFMLIIGYRSSLNPGVGVLGSDFQRFSKISMLFSVTLWLQFCSPSAYRKYRNLIIVSIRIGWHSFPMVQSLEGLSAARRLAENPGTGLVAIMRELFNMSVGT